MCGSRWRRSPACASPGCASCFRRRSRRTPEPRWPGRVGTRRKGSHRRRISVASIVATAVVVAAVLVPAAPAGAIVGGTPDTVHTNVGLVRFTTADGRFRCSGTLISPTVVLTAGHCTEGPATDVYVSFDDALQPAPAGHHARREGRTCRPLHRRHRQGVGQSLVKQLAKVLTQPAT